MKTKGIKAGKATAQKTLTKKVLFTKSETILIAVPAVNLKVGQKFKSFQKIAALFGAKCSRFRTFAYIGRAASTADVAIWGVNLNSNPYWNNRFIKDGAMLLESKVNKESRADFLKRIRKNLDYDANQLRMTFAKVKNTYYFIGVFQLSAIDIDNQTIIYKKVADDPISVFYKKMTKTLKITIEETNEFSEGMILI